MKKFLAILLSLMMLLSMAPTFAFANETADENEMPEVEFPEVLPDVYTVADFTEEDIVVNKSTGAVPNGLVSTGSNVSNVNQVDFFGYDDTNRSLEWNMQPMEFYVDLPVIDWNEYAYVNFRFYAPVAGQTFNYVYMGPDKFTSGKYYQRQIVTTGGWQVVTVPISDKTMQAAIAASADAKSIGYIIFSNNGWMISPGTPEQFANKETFLNEKNEKYTYKSILNEKVYFDKIWLEKSTVDYLDADSLKNGEDDAIQVIKSYAAPASTALSSRYTRSYENTRPGGAEMFTMVSIKEFGGSDLFFNNQDKVEDVNVDGYNWYNVWLYSPRPQSGGFVVWLDDASSANAIKISQMTNYVDWTGWKLFSYQIPSGKTDGDATKPDVDEIKVSFYGWDEAKSKGFAVAADGKVTQNSKVHNGSFGRWHTAGEIGVECAYLSKNKPALAGQVIATEGADARVNLDINENETDRVLYEASAANVAGQGTSNLSADTTNTRLYAQTAKSRMFGAKYIVATEKDGVTTYTLTSKTNKNGGVSATNTAATVYTAPKATVTNEDGTTKEVYTADAVNGNVDTSGYLNLWWYNPQIKYDQLGNPSEYILQVYYGVPGSALDLPFGTNPTSNPAGNKYYKTIGIINNWEGWKLISIPLTDVAPDLKKEGYFIGQINIATNEWVPAASGTDIKKFSRSFTDAQLAQHYETAGGSYNTWSDVYNFFMIDKVWVSSEKPAEDATVAYEHGINEVPVATTVFTANASENIGLITGEYSAYKRIGNEVTDVTDEFTFGYEGATFTATYNGEELEYDASYIINWPEFYSINGNKFEAGSSFYRARTIAYEIGSFTVDQAMDSASVSMKGNVPADSADNVIVAAVYDEAEGVKTIANVSLATYNAENGEIKAEITAEAGQVVTFMYLDSKISVKPLEADVSYTK